MLVIVLALLPAFLDQYRLSSMGGYLGFAILALSLDFVWGFGGIISFGQGALFGVGAYAVALGATSWHFPLSPVVGIVAGIGAAAIVAFLLGWFVFHAGIGGFYVAVFTLALSVLFEQLALQFTNITGGANGIIINRQLLPSDVTSSFYAMLLVFAAVLFLLLWITRSDFGRALVAIRDNVERARFLGYNAPVVQTFAFALAGAIAAIGGIMYASYSQLASPDLIGFAFSTQVLIWVAIGGRGSLVGAALGALIVNFVGQELGASLVQYWQLLLGAAFIAVVLLAPDGLYSVIRRSTGKLEIPQPIDLQVRPWMETQVRADANGTVLRTSGLAKDFGRFRALNRIDLELARGELCCLIGPNGAGKSTLVDVLSGRSTAAEGSALMMGASILNLPPDRLAIAGLKRKFQATNIFDTLTIAENLHLAATAGPVSARLFLHRTVRLDLPRPVVRLLEESGLLPRMAEPAGSLSHGDKQWLELCMVLASEPMLVLLDEPTAGLTAHERRQIGAVLRTLTADGLSVLLIEHDFDFVREVADRVAVLHQGQIVAQGSVSEMSDSRVVQDVYLGRSG